MGSKYILSWYLNPHLFWLRSIDSSDDFIRFEHKLDKFYKLQHSLASNYVPHVGEVIAYHDRLHSKWYRATVDCLLNEHAYILWLNDYGSAVLAYERTIQPLEKQFLEPKSFKNTIKAGISQVVPAKLEYDFEKACATKELVDKWEEKPVQSIKKFLEDANTIEFTKILRIADHQYGKVKVTTQDGNEIELLQSLISSPFAVKIKSTIDFGGHLKNLSTINVKRYQSILEENSKNTQKGKNVLGRAEKRNNDHRYRHESDTESTVHLQQRPVRKPKPKAQKQLAVKNDESPIKKREKTPEIPKSRLEDFDSFSGSSPIKHISTGSDVSEPKFTPKMPFERDPTQKSDIKFFGYSDTDSKSSKEAKKEEKKPDLTPSVEKFLERYQAKKNENKKVVQKETPVVTFMPAGYDQVLGQEQRAKRFEAERPKKSFFQRFAPQFGNKDNNSRRDSIPPRFVAKNTVMEQLEQKMAERKETNSVAVTSDDGTEYVGKEEGILNNSDVPIGAIDKLEELESPFMDCSVVLAHGNRIPKALKCYTDAPFHEKVTHAMKKRHQTNQTRRIQAHSWPHILHNRSAILISGPFSGKTQTLIPAVCTMVMRLFEDNLIPDSFGPVSIIVTPSVDGISEIVKELTQYLYYWRQKIIEMKYVKEGFEDPVTVTESYGQAERDQTMGGLLAGCGIFVTTPPAFARWVNKWKTEKMPLFNKDRLKLFAVDDFDKCYHRYGETICELIETFCDPKGHPEKEAPQLLITSTEWEPRLSKYFQYSINPALFIANYIEASVYGRTKFRLNFVKTAAKLGMVEQFLADNVYKTKRTAIICSTDDEVHQIRAHLLHLNVKHTFITHDSEESVRNEALTWHQSLSTEDFSVLICSDNVLLDLDGMKNVDRLLNYSLPEHWSTLSIRFTVFFEKFHDFVQKPKLPVGFEPTFAQILVDETNCRTLPRLVDFLRRLNAVISDEILVLARDMLILREGEKASLNLCPFFLHYGIKVHECMRKHCTGRHALSLNDAASARMPTLKMDLKLKITKVHNPIHFSGQILAYYKKNDWHLWRNENQISADADLKIKLQSYYADEKNKKKHFPVKKGDICAIDVCEAFFRAQILQVSEKRGLKREQNVFYEVRLIDTGEIHKKQFARDLYFLPKEFQEIPPRAIDIHMLGIVPYDSDMFWSRIAKASVEKAIAAFNKKATKEFYVEATVKFRVENNIWTHKMTLCEPVVDNLYHRTSLHRALLREKLAEKVDEYPQTDAMVEMARNLGFTELEEDDDDDDNNDDEEIVQEPQKIVIEVDEKPSTEPRSTWDYLNQDSLHQIVIEFLDDPKEFTIKRHERTSQERQLNTLIDNHEATSACKIIPVPTPGQNCLIPLDDGLTRGRIIDLGTDDQGAFVKVFSCDLGRTNVYDYSEIFETTKEIVEFMPYCAIKAKFAGIEPLDGQLFDEKATGDIWSLLDEAQAKGKLYAKVVKLNDDLKWLPGVYCYDLLVMVKNGNEMRFLNHAMVDKGLAKWDTLAGPTIEKMKPEHLEEETEASDEDQTWEDAIGTYQHEPQPLVDDENKPLDGQIEEALKELGVNLKGNDLYEFLAMMGANPMEIESLRRLNALKKKNSTSSISSTDTIPQKMLKIANPMPTMAPSPEIVPHINLPANNLVYKISPSLVLWQETNDVVIISIAVGDNPDYHLEVKKKNLIFATFPLTIDEEPRLTVINFFADVKPKLVSHNIRGLNIIIRLPKRWPGQLWRRLHVEDEKFQHVRYNLDTLNPLDEDFIGVIRENDYSDAESDVEINEDSDAVFEETDYESDGISDDNDE